MHKPLLNPGTLAGALTALAISIIPQTAAAGQKSIAIRNTGAGWYYPAYTDVFACREASGSDATCMAAFEECGPLAIGVYITMETAETITNPDWGDTLEVAHVRNGSVSDSICIGKVR